MERDMETTSFNETEHEQTQDIREAAATKDNYNATYILFCWIGVITQVPSNFFITAHEYWLYKFRDTSKPFDPTDDNKTELQAQFTSNYSIVSAVCSILFLFVTLGLAKITSTHSRMIGALVAQMVLFIITMIFVVTDTDSWQGGFYGLTLALGVILNASGSVLLISSILIALKFHPKFLAAELSGQAICGTFAALVQIISIANGQDSVKLNALIYFTFGLVVTIATLAYYLIQCNYSQFYIKHCAIQIEKRMKKPNKQMFKDVFKTTKYYLLAMMIISSSTSLIHPGLTALVKSTSSGTQWTDKFFVPVVTFFIYNLLDFMGREISPKVNKPTSDLWLCFYSVIRCALVPLIIFCNAQPRHHSSVGIHSDAAYIIFIIIFAFTHGYFFNLCVILLPSSVPQEKMIVCFILIMGVMMVATLAFSFLNAAMIKLI